jgi:hypothetical protein
VRQVGEQPMAGPVNPKLIQLLERKLAEAKAGKLTSAAVCCHYAADGGLMIDTEGDVAPLLLCSVQLTDQLRSTLFPKTAQMQPTPFPGARRMSS